MYPSRSILAALLVASPAFCQTASDPFPAPIPAVEGAIKINAVEFVAVPDVDGQAARMMILIHEPTTDRLFVNDMRGPLYSVSLDGKRVALYLDINAPAWGVHVNSGSRERGFQSFAFHPQFNRPGSPGFGKIYTLTDTENTAPPPDFTPGGGGNTHDSVLLEWTAKTPSAAAYDGGPPRELMRMEQPFANHNGGQLAFNPLSVPGTGEFGLLYMSFADGGSGGDPLNLAQNVGSVFGKILRIDPLGSNSANGRYGIPASNPLAADNDPKTLGEIYASGLRNPQRFAWDPKNGHLFVADIGQNTVEEVNLVTAGANFGWNVWEGSFKFVNRGIDLTARRADAKMTYPLVEYDHTDPLLLSRSAVTLGFVYRGTEVPALANVLIFGDNPSGEIFYVNADVLPQGGQSPIRRVLFDDRGSAKTLLQLIRDKNTTQGRSLATRADLRFGLGPDNRIFVLNKQDGIIRLMAAVAERSREDE
jgi:hypothetical protein